MCRAPAGLAVLLTLAVGCASLEGLTGGEDAGGEDVAAPSDDAAIAIEAASDADLGDEAAAQPVDSGDACAPSPIACFPSDVNQCDLFDPLGTRAFTGVVAGGATWDVGGGELRVVATGDADSARLTGATSPPRRFGFQARLRRKSSAPRIVIATATTNVGDIASLVLAPGHLELCPSGMACVVLGPWSDDGWHQVRWTLDMGTFTVRLDCGAEAESIASLTGEQGKAAIEMSFGILSTSGAVELSFDAVRID